MKDETDARLETLEALVTAQSIVIVALIQTHPHHEDWQLVATSLLEARLGGLESQLSPREAELIRDYVENKQGLTHLPHGAAAAYVRKHLPR